MIIKVLGPVGSGKSTVSKALAYALNLKYIPEVEENDIKFFRLLSKRNRTQDRIDRMEFQCYTFEQAYARQFGQENCVIDTPVSQHFIMAGESLTDADYGEYWDYYKEYLNKIKSEKEINIVLSLPFQDTLSRIRQRGRREETLSAGEIIFYKSFYDKLFVEKMYPEGSLIIDNTRDLKEVIKEILYVIALTREEYIGDNKAVL